MLTVVDQNFNWKDIGLTHCIQGNAMDTHYTAKIFHELYKLVDKEGLIPLYQHLIVPLISIFKEMEIDGLIIDQGKLQELKSQLEEKIREAESSLKVSDLVPDEINLNSNQQLCKVLFSLEKDKESGQYVRVEDVGFGLYPFEFTGKDQPSTSAETLEKVKDMVFEEYMKRNLHGSQE